MLFNELACLPAHLTFTRPDGYFSHSLAGGLGWGMGAVVGGIAGILIAPILFLEPNMMALVLLYAFAAAIRLGRTNVEHLADMFAPLYMWRASAFMSHTAGESPAVVQARLDSLCETFLRLKPALVARWSVEV